MRAAWIVFLFAASGFAQDLHFKKRTVTRSASERVGDDRAVHKIVEYDHPPGAAEIESLLREGLSVVAALPDNAIVVSAPGGILKGADGARWSGPLEADDKLSPALTSHAAAALVEFHSDVSPEQQETVASAAGLVMQRPAILQANHVLIDGSYADFLRLAQFDEVAYILPAEPALVGMDANGLLTCAGMLTASGPVGSYAAIVHGWNLDPDGFAHLTYLFGSLTPKVPTLVVQAELLRALNEWTRVTNVTFQPGANAAGPRNIMIRFASGSHGDAYAFDGPKNALAHTFYPVPINAEPIAGDMHMDADENWHAGGDPDIYSVALHEAGHAIGLGHSDNPGDVMYPYYRSRVNLSAGDIKAARVLYGEPGASARPETADRECFPRALIFKLSVPRPASSRPIRRIHTIRRAFDLQRCIGQKDWSLTKSLCWQERAL